MLKAPLIYTLLFALLTATAFAAVSTGDYSSPDNPGKCVIAPDVIVEPGTHQYPGDCARIYCNKSGFAEIQSCGVELAAPGCKFGELKQPNADYPDCCLHEVICE